MRIIRTKHIQHTKPFRSWSFGLFRARPSPKHAPAIKAVYPRDLDTLLMSLGVYEWVCQDREACYFCHATIQPQTIGAVFPCDDRVCFCCDRPECCRALMKREWGGDAGG